MQFNLQRPLYKRINDAILNSCCNTNIHRNSIEMFLWQTKVNVFYQNNRKLKIWYLRYAIMFLSKYKGMHNSILMSNIFQLFAEDKGTFPEIFNWIDVQLAQNSFIKKISNKIKTEDSFRSWWNNTPIETCWLFNQNKIDEHFLVSLAHRRSHKSYTISNRSISEFPVKLSVQNLELLGCFRFWQRILTTFYNGDQLGILSWSIKK